MKSLDLSISADIRSAHTLPADFYRSQDWFDHCREKVFSRSWHYIGRESDHPDAGHAQPFQLLPGVLNEPLLLVRDEVRTLRCLSNVCTHRGNLLLSTGGPCSGIRCRYHGRRFDLAGKMRSMPEFKGVKNFPSPEDDLPTLPVRTLGDLLFTAVNPRTSFEDWLQPVFERLSWLPFEQFRHAPQYARTFEVQAHWALYVDNYLEGFHIPFVHPGLNEALRYPDYQYELFDFGNLQLGVAKEGEPVLDVPSGSPDHGKNIYAYYFWFFPNLMLNFYPWGLSLNLVEPLAVHQTRVRFETFIWQEELFDPASIEALHVTEMEDEEVVESVQRGISSRLYHRGRYSPKMEVAVHHFHRLIADFVQ
jgi:choline monooxygenase